MNINLFNVKFVMKKMQQYQLKIHQETCKKLPCKYCSKEFDPSKINSHQIKCSFFEDQCLDCVHLFMRKYFGDHLIKCQKDEPKMNKKGLLKYLGVDQEFQGEGEEEVEQEEQQQFEEKNEEPIDQSPLSIQGNLTCSYCSEPNLTKEQLTQHIIDKHPDDPEHLIETLNFLF